MNTNQITIALVVALALSLVPVPAAHAASFIVTNTDDSGAGSLRQAIVDANTTAGADTITFSVSGTITPGTLSIADDVTIDGSGQSITISGNYAGRVMFVNPATTLTLQNLTIANGRADQGGGIYSLGRLNITNSTFSGNSAFSGGGIAIRFFPDAGTPTLNVTNSTFSGNRAEQTGGGISNEGGTATVTNSTFSGNSANSGGGIVNSGGGTLNVTNSTFSGNFAIIIGGGVANTGILHLRNTIVANSIAGGDCNTGTLVDNIHNLIEDGSCISFLSGDPNIGPLANNGGPTQTHALLPGSPAINAGDPATCAAAPVNNLDQRGIARPQGTTCDIGAFEVEQVVYNFSGFYQPVDNLPMLNVAKAGSAIPIKFSLGGDQGLNIFAADYPKSQLINCDSTAPNDGIEEMVTAGNSSLTYDVASDTYTYIWKTNKAWVNTCRQLTLRLSDGTDHIANFMFRK